MCYVINLFSASAVFSSLCYVTVLFLHGLQCFLLFIVLSARMLFMFEVFCMSILVSLVLLVFSVLLFAWFMLPNLLRHWSVLGLALFIRLIGVSSCVCYVSKLFLQGFH